MKRSVKLRVICLCISLAVLGSALLVAAATGSPYEVAKKAALETLKLQNGTLKLSMTLEADGVIQEVSSTVRAITESGSYSQNGSLEEARGHYESADFLLYSITKEGFYADRRTNYEFSDDLLDLGVDPDGRELRIAELVLDLLVGDLKNNIAISREGDSRTLSATILESQVPELYALLLDTMVSENSGYGSLQLVYNEVVDYDLDAMTAVLRSSYARARTNQIEEYKMRVRLIGEDDEEYGMYYDMYKGYEELTIEGKNYFYEHLESYDWTYTDVSTEELVAMAKSKGLYDNGKFAQMEFVGIESMRFTYGHAEATVNDDNIVTSLSGNASFTLTDKLGETCEVILRVEGSVSDIGSTVLPVPVDLDELDKAMGEFNNGYIIINPDGSLTCMERDYYYNYYNMKDVEVKASAVMTEGVLADPGIDVNTEETIDKDGKE